MYEHMLARIYNQPLPLHPDKLESIRRVLTNRAAGLHLDAASLEAFRTANEARRQPQITRSVAVLPIVGTLAKRGGYFEEASGLMSTDQVGREFDRLVADDAVGAIVLDWDSPGGESFGVPELAEKIFQARGSKPIVSSVNAEMASAALWIGSAAGEVTITPSGWIGSHGVYMAHTDLSAANEQLGVKTTYISAGPYKVEWTGDAPLSDDTRAYYQAQVDAVYEQFTRDLARFRGLKAAEVKANYGGGRMVQAPAAKAAGIVNRIETLDETIARLAAGGKPKRSGTRAARERLALA